MRVLAIQFLLSAFFLTGCAPKLAQVRAVDLSAGYTKTAEFEVRPRLAKRIEYSFEELRPSGISAVIAPPSGDNVLARFPGSESLPGGSEMAYQFVATFSWPMSGKRRKEILPISTIVQGSAKLAANQDQLCLAEGESTQVSFGLSPAPEVDSVRLEVTSASPGIELVIHPQPSPGSFIVTVDARTIGSGGFVASVRRSQINDVSLPYRVVPRFSPPATVSAGPPTQGEAIPDPPEVDGFSGAPVAMRWQEKPGAERVNVEIFNRDDERVASLGQPPDALYLVVWLTEKDGYSWRVRAQVPICSGASDWTPFSPKMSIPGQ